MGKKLNSSRGIILMLLSITIVTIAVISIVMLAKKSENKGSTSSNESDNGVIASRWKYDSNGNITDGEKTLEIGDYVNYKPASKKDSTSVTSYKTENGYQDQTFNLKDYSGGWQVLGIEDGKILLVSEGTVGIFKLKGEAAYINAVSELNNISSMYGKGEHATGARSITVDDVNRITGYNPETAEYAKGKLYEFGNEVTFYWDENDALYYESTNGVSGLESSYYTEYGFIWYDGSSFKKSKVSDKMTSNAKEKITTLKSTNYIYSPNSLTEKLTGTNGLEENEEGKMVYNKSFKMLFGSWELKEEKGFLTYVGEDSFKSYWLASPYISTASSRNDNIVYGLFEVKSNEVIGAGYMEGLYTSAGNPIREDYSNIRVVVSLDPNVQLDYNDKTKKWNFID